MCNNAILLSKLLLYSEKNKPLFIKVIIFILHSLSAISICFLLSPYYFISVPLTRINGLFTILGLLFLTIYLSIFKKSKVALLILLSWFPFLIGAVLMVLSLNGFIAPTPYISFFPYIATVFQSLILALTVGSSIVDLLNTIILEQNEKIIAYKLLDENFIKLKERDNIIRSYVNPTVLAEISININPLEYIPKEINKIILFADLRDYTSITESISLDEAYMLLNKYFEAFNNAIVNHGGEVDKLIGDAIMATFNDGDECVLACIEFYVQLEKINRERIKKGLMPLNVGVGISFGKILSANFGTSHKLDRTIVGDFVNLASRLESLTKNYNVKILCSFEFTQLLSNRFEISYVDEVLVKGKSITVKVYEIKIESNILCEIINEEKNAHDI